MKGIEMAANDFGKPIVRLALLAMCLAAAVGVVRAQAEPGLVWRRELDGPVSWFKMSPPGVLVVGTDREILGVAPDSGNVLWRLGPLEDSHWGDLELLPGRAEALLNVGKKRSSGAGALSLIDLRDGDTLWTGQREGMLRSMGSLPLPGTDHLLVRATLSADGSKKSALLVDVASGGPIWTSESIGGEFEPVLPFWHGACLVRTRQVPLRDTDSSMIVHMRDGMFRRFDLKTGAPVWTAQGKPVVPYTSTSDMEHQMAGIARRASQSALPKNLRDDEEEEEDWETDLDLAPMLRSSTGGRFYAPYQRSVAAFSLATGELLWRAPPKLDAVVAQMEETPAGLLVRTIEPDEGEYRQRVLLLDVETGAVQWRWPRNRGLARLVPTMSSWRHATNFLLEEDRIVIAAEGKLLATDLAHHQVQTLVKLKFEHLDDARTLASVPGGYAIVGRSNLGLYTKADGLFTRKYHREPPDGSGLGLALLAMSAATKGWVSPKLGLEALEIDLSESEERERYVYFLAQMKVEGKSGPGLVRVRLDTGDTDGEIQFGRRTPTYALDSNGRIFYLTDSKTMLCRRF